MATPTHNSSLDHVITVKVMYEGITRRTKMPLRDMVPRTLESNVSYKPILNTGELQIAHHLLPQTPLCRLS